MSIVINIMIINVIIFCLGVVHSNVMNKNNFTVPVEN